MKRALRSGALAAAVAVTATLLSATPSVADDWYDLPQEPVTELEKCPEGWEVPLEGENSLGGILQFCRLALEINSIGDTPEYAVFVKVPAHKVGQAVEYATTGEQESNPMLVSRSAQGWLRWGRDRDATTVLAINGTYYDPEGEGGPTDPFNMWVDYGRMAFPVYTQAIDPWSELVATGKDPMPPANGVFEDERRCISWRAGTDATVQSAPWELEGNDYFDTLNELDAPLGCTRGEGAALEDAEFLVGYDPWFDFGEGEGDYRSLTMVGVTTTSSVRDNTLCFLVGGWYDSPADAAFELRDFGCEPILQLDGGHSSQLSYYDPVIGLRSPVPGYDFFHYRYVPHALLIQ